MSIGEPDNASHAARASYYLRTRQVGNRRGRTHADTTERWVKGVGWDDKIVSCSNTETLPKFSTFPQSRYYYGDRACGGTAALGTGRAMKGR